MARTSASVFSRRLLLASVVFGLFVLCDIALFGWLIFRSLSQREVERVLLETRSEANRLAQQLASRAEGQGNDLYTAIAVERETQTYIDSILRQRDIVRDVEIRDKNGILVFRDSGHTTLVARDQPPVISGPERAPGLETRTVNREAHYELPNIRVSIGDLGVLVITVSEPELAKRIAVLRGELVKKTTLVGAVTIAFLLTAYVAIWFLLRNASRLETQAAEAERLAYIGTLASGLAHEIRSPLNSLNLNMQMLEEEAPTENRLLAITRSEISRLERLVTDFLAYAKPRPLELEELPAAWLLERATAVLAGEIQVRQAQVEIEDRSGGARVRVDVAQMQQLLLNLLQNALAATEGSGRPAVLRLLAHRQAGDVVLEIADNGRGMSPEEQAKIFEIFYSTRKGGTGLGLAIVDRIARAHGGRLAVRSTAGSGTSVLLTLPAVQPEGAGRERPALEIAPGI